MCLVSVQNVCVGLRVTRGRHWRTGKWNMDKCQPGTVIGFADNYAKLIGSNTNASYFDRFYLDNRGIVSVGPEWCAVRWDATSAESIYPIGARGPLGKWWTRADANIGYGDKCFALEVLNK